jgi:hypothetical protein
MADATTPATPVEYGSSWKSDEAKTVHVTDSEDANYAARIVENENGTISIIAGVPEEDTAFHITITLADWDRMLGELHDKDMLTI